jgi:transposase
MFTCNIEDIATTETARKLKWVETGEVTKKGKRRKSVAIPSGLVACAIDLGIRNLGFATVATYRDGQLCILRSRNIWIGQEEQDGSHPGRWSAGPDLAHLARHKREIRLLRRQRGKPVKGELSHVELQDHITHMAEDRFKKAARAIVTFALNTDRTVSSKTGEPHPGADVLLVENLATLLPDAERERGINRSLIEFNRGHMVERLKEVAKDVGVKCLEVSPVGTSQVCSRCGQLGRRYTVGRDQTGLPDIRFGPVEKLFACRCGYRSNSDHNASVNLHRRFCLGDAAVKAFLDFHAKPDAERRHVLETLESDLLPSLRQIHRLEAAAAPF